MNDSIFRLAILGALGLCACASRPADPLGDGDTTSEGDGDGDEPVDPTLCDDPQPIMQAGTDIPSGFVRCADGFVHRAEAVACDAPAVTGVCSNPLDEWGCESDADCVAKPFGSCSDNFDEGACNCSYGCETDADCDAGLICACAGVVSSRSHCVPAGCPDDSACDEGLCGLETWTECAKLGQLACTNEASSCRADDGCGVACEDENENQPLRCAAALGWNCQTAADVYCGEYCGEGRPFVVDGELRTAQLARGRGWSVGCSVPGDADLSDAVRLALAAYWSQVGLYEHASVASFARFGLQLMVLGAPPRLLAATRRATLDEIEHARLGFGLASRFAGHPLGPDGLAVAGALRGVGDLHGIVRSLIHEACVGETLAAIEARHAAELATDAHAATIHDQIARDELRHAELGWTTLRWLLEIEQADASLRRFALDTLDAAMW